MPPETEGTSCGPSIDERTCPTPVCGMYLKIHKREISIVARITVFSSFGRSISIYRGCLGSSVVRVLEVKTLGTLA